MLRVPEALRVNEMADNETVFEPTDLDMLRDEVRRVPDAEGERADSE